MLTSDQFLRRKLMATVGIIVAVAASLAISRFTESQRTLFWEIVTGLGALTRDDLNALILTFGTALFAWIVAVLFGTALAVAVAVAYLADSKLTRVVTQIDTIYQAIYIIPLVLTISLSYAVCQQLRDAGVIRPGAVPAILVAVSGLALGGFQVYRSVFSSVKQAKESSRYLVLSLYRGTGGRWPRLQRWRNSFATVLRLRDCEIHSYCEAIVLAFHLAIVSVMILEMVCPHFYENMFPQSGVAPSWLGGVGFQLLTAQSRAAVGLVAGYMWAVLIVDLVFASLVELWLYRRWRRHYQ